MSSAIEKAQISSAYWSSGKPPMLRRHLAGPVFKAPGLSASTVWNLRSHVRSARSMMVSVSSKLDKELGWRESAAPSAEGAQRRAIVLAAASKAGNHVPRT